jgi:hypothetical protein
MPAGTPLQVAVGAPVPGKAAPIVNHCPVREIAPPVGPRKLPAMPFGDREGARA